MHVAVAITSCTTNDQGDITVNYDALLEARMDFFSSAGWGYFLAYVCVQLLSVPSLHAEWSSQTQSVLLLP